MRIAPRRSPFASQNDSVAQLASRYPAGPLLTHLSEAAFARRSGAVFAPSIGASTPSSETAMETAPSGICRPSRSAASKASRLSSQRSASTFGRRPRLLFDGVMLPTRSKSSALFLGVICVTPHSRLLRRARGPEVADDSERQPHRTDAAPVRTRPVLVERPLDHHLARRGHVRLRLPQHAAMNLARDHDRIDIHVPGHLAGDDVALRFHHPIVHLALELLERPRSRLRPHPRSFEELAELLQRRRLRLVQVTRGRSRDRYSTRALHVAGNAGRTRKFPAFTRHGGSPPCRQSSRRRPFRSMEVRE